MFGNLLPISLTFVTCLVKQVGTDNQKDIRDIHDNKKLQCNF